MRSLLAAIAPIAGVVFVAFFVIGLAMPVLPLHVHERLGMSAFVVGLVAGAQFTAALVSRLWAGRITDSRGPKRAVLLGLIGATLGAGCYLLSLSVVAMPVLSVAILLLGRALVGGAESLIITGGILWGLGRASPNQSAQVIAWVGMSMFAAMAIAAPLGSLVYFYFAFEGIAIASVVFPLAMLALISLVRPLAPVATAKAPFAAVLQAVVLPGLGFALSGITFAAVTSFLTLFFADRGWAHGALAITIFSVALIAMRVVAGHIPDRFGGARVALYSLFFQAAGLTLIGNSLAPWVACIGAALAGAGFSLVFPSLGLEAVQRVPPANRGMAMGLYNAFLDLTLAVGSPALGWFAVQAGVHSVFNASACAALMAVPIALTLLKARSAQTPKSTVI